VDWQGETFWLTGTQVEYAEAGALSLNLYSSVGNLNEIVIVIVNMELKYVLVLYVYRVISSCTCTRHFIQQWLTTG
jgi:hypothetical protein